ncbi:MULTISPECIES: YbjN domain-containing protein [unclassified Coleofasciculus]|uniref:YbjN domain-containing protein n=1 Tax=unclassified Coleofasciculus TaxID=2692782 RepID=UPI001D146BDA|nr:MULTISPECIES: YbjN domain-containing protein [unclassified Coleofasciculus]
MTQVGYAQAIEAQQQFIFYSLYPIKIPKSKRRAVGEFLSRANYGMIIGNFELNFDDGEIRYKTSTNVKNHSLDADTIKQLVYTNVNMTDEYLPGIIAVTKGGVSPVNAICHS